MRWWESASWVLSQFLLLSYPSNSQFPLPHCPNLRHQKVRQSAEPCTPNQFISSRQQPMNYVLSSKQTINQTLEPRSIPNNSSCSSKLSEVGETQPPLLTCCLARARIADYPILSISNASLNPLFASGFLPMMHFNPTPGFLGNDKLIIWPPSVNDFTPHHTASHVKHQLTTLSSMYLVEPPIFTVFIRCLHFGILSHTSRQPLSPALHFP